MFSVAKTKPDNELLMALANSANEIHFSSALELCRLQKHQEDIAKFSWSTRLSPSAPVIEFDMCMKDLEEEVLKPVCFSRNTLMRVNWGTALHKGIEHEVLQYADALLYPKPTITNNPEKAERLKRIWPEVPVWHSLFGFSGQADCVMKLNGKPAPIDYKTKWVKPENWAQDKDDRGKQLPYSSQIAQVAIYLLCIIENNLYGGVIPEQIGIVMFNLLLAPEDPQFIKEYWYPVTEELIFKTKLMMAYCARHRIALMNNRTDLPCTYPLCPKHGQGIQLVGSDSVIHTFTPRVSRKPETTNAPKSRNTTSNFIKRLREEQQQMGA